MKLIANSPSVAKVAPAEMAGEAGPNKPALLNRQRMRSQPHQGPKPCDAHRQLIIRLTVNLVGTAKISERLHTVRCQLSCPAMLKPVLKLHSLLKVVSLFAEVIQLCMKGWAHSATCQNLRITPAVDPQYCRYSHCLFIMTEVWDPKLALKPWGPLIPSALKWYQMLEVHNPHPTRQAFATCCFNQHELHLEHPRLLASKNAFDSKMPFILYCVGTAESAAVHKDCKSYSLRLSASSRLSKPEMRVDSLCIAYGTISYQHSYAGGHQMFLLLLY